MKYPCGFGLQLPFVNTKEDGTSEHCYALLHTNDPVDRRKVKQIIRKWVKSALGRSLSQLELRLLLKRVVPHIQPMQYVQMPMRPVEDADDTTQTDA